MYKFTNKETGEVFFGKVANVYELPEGEASFGDGYENFSVEGVGIVRVENPNKDGSVLTSELFDVEVASDVETPTE